MNQELKDIFQGIKRSLLLVDHSDKIALLMASAIMLITGLLTNWPAIILGNFVDTLLGGSEIHFESAVPYILLIVVIILVREALTVVRKYLIENVATQTEKKQTVAVIDRLLKADLTYIHQRQVGSLHGQIFRSIQGLIRVIKLSFLDFLPTFFSAMVALVIVFYRQPLIGGVMFLVIPIGLLIVFRQIGSQKGIRVSLLRGKEKIDGKVVETLHGLETVRVLNAGNQEVTKVAAIAERLRIKEITHHIQMALYDSAKYLNEGFFYIATISLAIYLAANRVISGGDILVFSVLFLSITNPLREIHRILDQAHEGSILVNDLYGLLHQPIDTSFIGHTKKVDKPLKKSSVVEIENLSFSYKQALPILRNVNLQIKSGEKLGLVGASGSGKSTLLKILLRLVHGYQGTIKLFGQFLENLDREVIAKQIAYVPQHTFIFAGTIRDNILYGFEDKKISDELIIEAAKQANIHQEIEESLGGLEGRVAEGGSNLSGGQQQRLAIARLILRSPDLFIFDEATSALDNVNEAAIQANIEEHFKGKAMIIVAHRLSTLKNVDRIIVFDQGEIVQEGSYDKLTKQKGLFADFLAGKKAFN